MRLSIDGVTVRWGDHRAVDGVSLTVEPGAFVALLGPNGSGKSTLLRTIYRVLRPSGGTVWLDEADLWRASERQVARTVGVLAQEHHAGFDFSVAETVAFGRTPHLGSFDRASAEDVAVVDAALEQTGTSDLAQRTLSTLSGGERQRVLLARALAQQPRLLILDEPTNHLDPRHRFELLELVRGLGVSVLSAQHDLDLAAAYADMLVVLREGRVEVAGAPAQVLTAGVIRRVFGLEADVHADPGTGRPRIHLRPACVCPARPCHWSCTATRLEPAEEA